jgi:acetyltransferase-like isoleucine patch superfamily enzyme
VTSKGLKRHLFKIDPFKTIYFNLKCFDIRTAIRFPILISWGVKIISLRGDIHISGPLSTGMVIIGTNCSWDQNGEVIFKGKARLGKNSHFYIGTRGELSFGNNFWLTSDGEINCTKNISFGDDCLVAWEVDILDTDFHKIHEAGVLINSDEKILIEDHVWIGSRSTILKGTFIGHDIIIGACSLLNKSYTENFSIYAGSPAKLVKTGVTWEA